MAKRKPHPYALPVEKRKSLTKKQRARLFLERDGRCHRCRRKIGAGERWIDEHFISLENGGSNDWSNRDLTCTGCFYAKNREDRKKASKGRRIREGNARHAARMAEKLIPVDVRGGMDGGEPSATTKKRVRAREYRVWCQMKARCYNPSSPRYHRYAGRGITVCERWRHSYANFLQDMGECPVGCSLERVDNNGGYSPENCVWADMKTQCRNKECSRLATIDGTTMTLNEWCRHFRMASRTVWSRMKRGMSPQEALENALDSRHHRFNKARPMQSRGFPTKAERQKAKAWKEARGR